jgi:hypothetical protein
MTAYREVGGLSHDTLAEDTDLTLALHRSKWRVAYAPNAVAFTEAPETLATLAKQRFRWAYGTMQCLWKHRDMVLNPRFGALGFFGGARGAGGVVLRGDDRAAGRTSREYGLMLLSRNGVVFGSCLAVVVGMVGMSYAAVPLYDLFCRATGYGGTPNRAEAAPEDRRRFLDAVGKVFHPDAKSRRQLVKATVRLRKAARIAKDESALRRTGARARRPWCRTRRAGRSIGRHLPSVASPGS